MEMTKKNIQLICWGYGFIVVIANLIGSLIPSTISPDIFITDFSSGREAFIQKYYLPILITSCFAYILPALACIRYLHGTKGGDKKTKIINLPFAFALRGSLGWVFQFFLELVFMLIAQKEYEIIIYNVLLSSFFYLAQEGLFSFTIAYFLMETIHRRYVLPKYFSEESISNRKGVKQISVDVIFTIFYISTGLLPVIFIFCAYITTTATNNLKIENNIISFLFIIIAISLLICVIMAKFFSVPLRKLTKATKKIEAGEYGHKVDIVSNDSFGNLAEAFNSMSNSLLLQAEKIDAIQNSVITGMAIMVESRDNSTGGHIMRTSKCVNVFSKILKNHSEYGKLPDKFYNDVIKAAPMHDLGKIAVDDAILRKPGKFTDEEYEKMKAHSAEGARIVESVLKEVDDLDFKKIAINVAHYHHEKWNGSGYPAKISGEQIPLEARIMALADVFDALVSKRCYKDSFTYDKAFQIIEESLGSHFDPELGAEFIKCRPQLEALYNSFEA